MSGNTMSSSILASGEHKEATSPLAMQGANANTNLHALSAYDAAQGGQAASSSAAASALAWRKRNAHLSLDQLLSRTEQDLKNNEKSSAFGATGQQLNLPFSGSSTSKSPLTGSGSSLAVSSAKETSTPRS